MIYNYIWEITIILFFSSNIATSLQSPPLSLNLFLSFSLHISLPSPFPTCPTHLYYWEPTEKPEFRLTGCGLKIPLSPATDIDQSLTYQKCGFECFKRASVIRYISLNQFLLSQSFWMMRSFLALSICLIVKFLVFIIACRWTLRHVLFFLYFFSASPWNFLAYLNSQTSYSH